MIFVFLLSLYVCFVSADIPCDPAWECEPHSTGSCPNGIRFRATSGLLVVLARMITAKPLQCVRVGCANLCCMPAPCTNLAGDRSGICKVCCGPCRIFGLFFLGALRRSNAHGATRAVGALRIIIKWTRTSAQANCLI